MKCTISNYKKSDYLEIDIVNQLLVITGPNNSGKTQLLWVFILVFHACQLSETGEYRKQKQCRSDIASLLDHPMFGSLRDYKSFVNKDDTNSESDACAQFTAYIDNTPAFSVLFYTSGVLAWQCDNVASQQFRYAYMGSKFHFARQEQRWTENDPLSSSQQIFRQVYHELSPHSKSLLLTHMQTLFHIKHIKAVTGSRYIEKVMIIDHNDFELEIIVFGSGFQRIFAMFIMTYYLSEQREAIIKVLLINDLEAHLHGDLSSKVFEILRDICSQSSIYLIITSTVDCILNSVDDHQKLILNM